MKKICLLGATGSIGMQVADICSRYQEYKIISASCNKSFEKLEKLINQFKIKKVWVGNKSYLEDKYQDVHFYYDNDGLKEIVNDKDVDIVINSLVGVVGLKATIEAIKAKKDILLANKESLVLAGDIINKMLKENNVKLFPIDSEHSAILQCLEGRHKEDIKQIIITASGGALRDLTRDELKGVTIDKVLAHPTWNMGGKITVDCATMVNKGFEVIEAHHLFNVPYEKIATVLHQESIIHGAVVFNDGAIIANMGPTDMHLPIQYALTYPKRLECTVNKEFDLTKTFAMHFKEMDYNRYPMLKLAYEVANLGGIMPAVYCASNDVAVNKFLKGEIEFLDIEEIIVNEVNNYLSKNISNPTLDDIYNVIEEIKSRY